MYEPSSEGLKYFGLASPIIEEADFVLNGALQVKA
jgi:hypothetical protein